MTLIDISLASSEKSYCADVFFCASYGDKCCWSDKRATFAIWILLGLFRCCICCGRMNIHKMNMPWILFHFDKFSLPMHFFQKWSVSVYVYNWFSFCSTIIPPGAVKHKKKTKKNQIDKIVNWWECTHVFHTTTTIIKLIGARAVIERAWIIISLTINFAFMFVQSKFTRKRIKQKKKPKE